MTLPQSQQKLEEHFLHVILLHPPYFCMLAPHFGHGCTLPLDLIHTNVYHGGVGRGGREGGKKRREDRERMRKEKPSVIGRREGGRVPGLREGDLVNKPSSRPLSFAPLLHLSFLLSLPHWQLLSPPLAEELPPATQHILSTAIP